MYDLGKMDFCTTFFTFVACFLALFFAAAESINKPEDQCCVKVDTNSIGNTSQIIDATG
jgi:hypothetical protein